MIRRILSQLHRYVMWALISVVVWSWVFTFLTDAAPARKVVVYSDTFEEEDRALMKVLEQDLPDGIRLVRVHPFSYAVFDTGEIGKADILILSELKMESWIEKLHAVPEAKDGFRYNGEIYGIPIYDAATGTGAATSYFQFTDGNGPAQNFYLCFNRNSLHLGAWNDSQDDAAIRIADTIMQLP